MLRNIPVHSIHSETANAENSVISLAWDMDTKQILIMKTATYNSLDYAYIA